MNMRLRGMSLLAAAAVAGAGLVATAPTASAADPSPQTAQLCNNVQPNTLRKNCAIGITSNVVEGQQAKVVVYGNPGTYKLKVYWVDDQQIRLVNNEAFALPGEITAVVPANGMVEVSFPAPKLPAPAFGGKYFMVQMADWTKDKGAIMSSSLFQGDRWNTFTIRSARAEYRTINYTNLRVGQTALGNFGGGITGQRYEMQIKVGNEWRNVTSGGGVIDDLGNGRLEWKAPELPRGTYDMRVINTNTGDVVWNGTYAADGAALPGNPGTPAPSAKPSAPAPAKKDNKGGLAKTGL